MKVTDIKIFTVDCFRTNWVFVKVYTDEGITGVGEATLEYKEKALWGAVEHIKEYLVGKNPLDIEKHWHAIYRDAYWRGGPVLMSALSAVEMALWDILGKYLNGIAGQESKCVSGNFQTVFQSGYTILHSHLQYMSVLVEEQVIFKA